MRNLMRGLAVALVALAIVGGTIPASAVPPKKNTYVDEGWFTLVFTDETTKAAFTGCEGFSEVMNSERATELTYYDKAGDAVKASCTPTSTGRSPTQTGRPSATTPSSPRATAS